jgi:hypothetical protein
VRELEVGGKRKAVKDMEIITCAVVIGEAVLGDNGGDLLRCIDIKGVERLLCK